MHCFDGFAEGLRDHGEAELEEDFVVDVFWGPGDEDGVGVGRGEEAGGVVGLVGGGGVGEGDAAVLASDFFTSGSGLVSRSSTSDRVIERPLRRRVAGETHGRERSRDGEARHIDLAEVDHRSELALRRLIGIHDSTRDDVAGAGARYGDVESRTRARESFLTLRGAGVSVVLGVSVLLHVRRVDVSVRLGCRQAAVGGHAGRYGGGVGGGGREVKLRKIRVLYRRAG